MRELPDAHKNNLSQATIPVIKNKSLLDNIRHSEDFIRVDGIGGHIIIDQVGEWWKMLRRSAIFSALLASMFILMGAPTS